MSISLSIVSTFTRSLLGRLPACVRDLAISWHKNLSNTIDEGDTYDYVKDSIGTRTDDVYYGQYLDVTSGQINFYRTSGTFDYTDPSDGTLVEGATIPGTGLYTVPANGICDIGVYPKVGSIEGLLEFVGVDDYVRLNSNPDVTGTKIISFSCILRKTSGYNGDALFEIPGVNSDYIRVILNQGTLIFTKTESAGENQYINITDLGDQQLDIVINKTSSGFTSIFINSVEVSTTVTTGVTPPTNSNIGLYEFSSKYLDDALFWDLNINGEHLFPGNPEGNTDAAWDDTIGVITATVNGSPNTINIDPDGTFVYTSFYPIAERAGTVLHDIYENSYHISVDTPVWAESLYGSDYLNQQGFIDKVDSDTLGYDWETVVNTNPVTLNDNTLVPLAQWGFSPLIDSLVDPIIDSLVDPIYAKDNI